MPRQVVGFVLVLPFFGMASGCEDVFLPEVLPEVPAAAVPEVLLDGLDDPAGLAHFADGGFVLAVRGAGTLYSLDPDGAEIGDIVSGLPGPDRLAVVDALLVVSTADEPGLWAVDPSGAVSPLWGGDAPVVGLSLVSQRLWFVLGLGDSTSPSLRWLDLDSKDHGVITEDLDDPGGFTVVDDTVFLADPGRGELLAFDRLSGSETVLAVPDEDPRDVVWDDGDLFFTARSDRWPGGGWIYATAETGGALSPLSYSPPGIDRLSLAGDFLYWSSAQSITRAPRDGGTYEVLASETRVADFLVLPDRLVWTDPDRGQLLSVPLDP
jgi:hypothetical protein